MNSFGDGFLIDEVWLWFRKEGMLISNVYLLLDDPKNALERFWDEEDEEEETQEMLRDNTSFW